MAEEKNKIKLNPSKPSKLEFDVMVSGLDGAPPTVRFVVQQIKDGLDWVVSCKKLEGSKWEASFPAFTNIELESCKFCVEVIVDEYFFTPAQGEISFIGTPDVSFNKQTITKPTVTTSFVVKQEDEKPKTKPKKVSEAMGGGEVTGQFAPTNGLLVPEEDPSFTHSNVKTAQAEKDDQFIDYDELNDEVIDDIADEVVPGEGIQYRQSDGKQPFNPKDVAKDIIRKTMGSSAAATAPTKKGSLFARDGDDKAIVPGLESRKQQLDKDERTRRVHEILGK